MDKQKYLNIAISQHENEGSKVAEIDIYGAIGEIPFSDEGNSKQSIKDQLDAIRKLEVDEITVNVSSTGGIVDDAVVIYDLLRENKAKVTTKISGYTASAGTIIALAGDEVTMSENSLFLIHRARTMAVGSVNDMESVIRDLKKTDERISNIYSKKGGKDTSFYMEWMGKENGNGVWLDADEVLNELNLIDSIDKQEYKKAAYISPEEIKNMGLPAIPENKVKDSNTKELKYDVTLDIDDSKLEEIEERVNAIQDSLEDVDEASIDKAHRKAQNSFEAFLKEQENQKFINNEYFKTK